MSVELHLGDCLDVLRTLDAGSVDAVVTDPPAGIGFMGKGWDSDRGGRREWIGWLSSVLAECLRVAKPGSVLLCWALPRTSHWTGTAIEDAGWIIEDRLAHHFGSGFPKHGSKLKPATEDWWLARKPGPKWLNVDGCRVAAPEGLTSGGQCSPKVRNTYAQDEWTLNWDKPRSQEHPAGRWPANLVMSHSPGCVRRGTKRVKPTRLPGGSNPTRKDVTDWRFQDHDRNAISYADPDGLETVADYACADDCPIRLMGEQSGERSPGARPARRGAGTAGYHGWPNGTNDGKRIETDSGTAARFFPNFDADPFLYQAKASRKDRGEGNTHPTVKPAGLCEWLVRLATPPGGIVLDPFMGSGSIGAGASREGFSFIGIEIDPQYHDIASQRIEAATRPMEALWA